MQNNLRARSLFTTSWDDGFPKDVKLAALLQKHSIKGTFYVPSRNMEGRPVLADSDIREIAGEFEIGSHTLDHCYLDSIPRSDAWLQIINGKNSIENILGRNVDGFCYPGGRHNKQIRQMVRDAGFFYARKVSNIDLDLIDPYQMPTTIQFYPHKRQVFIKNYLTNGSLFRGRLLPTLLKTKDIKSQLFSAIEYVAENGGVFHLWGHSWEFDFFNGWVLLDEVLKFAKNILPKDSFVENRQLANMLVLPK